MLYFSYVCFAKRNIRRKRGPERVNTISFEPIHLTPTHMSPVIFRPD